MTAHSDSDGRAPEAHGTWAAAAGSGASAIATGGPYAGRSVVDRLIHGGPEIELGLREQGEAPALGHQEGDHVLPGGPLHRRPNPGMEGHHECPPALHVRLAEPPPLRRADDGLDGPARPLLPAPAVPAHAALHGDGDHRGHPPWGQEAAPGLLARGAAVGPAARGQRAGEARRVRAHRRAVGLRRGEPERRLPLGPGAERHVRCVPDGEAGPGGPVCRGDARRHPPARHRQAPPGHRRPGLVRAPDALRAHGERGGL